MTLPVYFSDRYQLFSVDAHMSPQTTDQATHVILHSPFSPTQAERELRRVLEPANAARLFHYTREANRALFAGTIEHNQFHLQLVHPYERQRYTLSITGEIAAEPSGSIITIHITDAGIILPAWLLRLLQIAIFAILVYICLSFVSLWWNGSLSFGCGIFPSAVFLFALWLAPALGKSDPDTANAISHLRTVFAAESSRLE